MADMALFLASPQAKYVTGQIMAVDGGWTAYGYT
jgi:NAD(P)-dependent dehydrogenase (short-subunit alcohol dehydrogenase family)